MRSSAFLKHGAAELAIHLCGDKAKGGWGAPSHHDKNTSAKRHSNPLNDLTLPSTRGHGKRLDLQQTTPHRREGPSRLITRIVIDHPLCGRLVLGGRQYRKGLQPHLSPAGREHLVPFSSSKAWRGMFRWNLNTAMALLFILGSSCFALAGFQAAFPDLGLEILRHAATQNVCFFVGSIFFTSAAFLQWQQSIQFDLSKAHLPAAERWKWWDWRFHDAGYMASFSQFIGTLFFNLNTGLPLMIDGSWLEQDLMVWAPNFSGSVLFLVSSCYACVEVGQKFWVFAPRNYSWWIAQSNLLGSIFFQVSAFLSFVPPNGLGATVSFWASVWTSLGGICFFLAAYLMLPEQADELRHPEMDSDTAQER